MDRDLVPILDRSPASTDDEQESPRSSRGGQSPFYWAPRTTSPFSPRAPCSSPETCTPGTITPTNTPVSQSAAISSQQLHFIERRLWSQRSSYCSSIQPPSMTADEYDLSSDGYGSSFEEKVEDHGLYMAIPKRGTVSREPSYQPTAFPAKEAYEMTAPKDRFSSGDRNMATHDLIGLETAMTPAKFMKACSTIEHGSPCESIQTTPSRFHPALDAPRPVCQASNRRVRVGPTSPSVTAFTFFPSVPSPALPVQRTSPPATLVTERSVFDHDDDDAKGSLRQFGGLSSRLCLSLRFHKSEKPPKQTQHKRGASGLLRGLFGFGCGRRRS